MLRILVPLLFIGGFTSCYGTKPALGSDLPELQKYLTKPILAPEQPQAEVERYLEGRIPRLPDMGTREAWERQSEQIRNEMLAKIILRGQGMVRIARPAI
jgi:hypothetical protein